MTDEDLVVLGAADVAAILRDEEGAVLAAVTGAYDAHGRGRTVVPHSAFLGLPGGRDRIIALPAYLGRDDGLVGMKWIASFPGNLERGLPRASGLVVLNCPVTGRPRAVLDGAAISAGRTAASAALAARLLHAGTPLEVGVLGCGLVSFETVRFLRHVWPDLARLVAYDRSLARGERFAARCLARWPGLGVDLVGDPERLLAGPELLVIATTAARPHVATLAGSPVRTVLHLSLRDLAPEIVLAADNVVDDVDHACRAETSLHLAEQRVGHRGFIGRTLPAIVTGAAPAGGDHDRPTIFSPFGLGILDIAVAAHVWDRARARGMGTRLPFVTRDTL